MTTMAGGLTPSPAELMESLRQLIVALHSLQASRYTSAAAATIYVYNIFLTFGDEVEYFWSRLKFTFPDLLYIINRYVCLAFFLNTVYDLAGFRPDLTEEYCRKYTEVIGFVLVHMGWTGVMTIRVSALWQEHPRLVKLIWFLWAITLVTLTVLGSLSCKQVVAGMTYNRYIRMCAPASSPRILASTPIGPTTYELFLTTLTLIKAYSLSKHAKVSQTPILLRVLTRDGVSYFVLSTLLSLANIISWYLLPASLMYLFLYLYWALGSTVIAALVLNLRQTYYRGLSGESMTFGPEVSANITFDPSATTEKARERRVSHRTNGMEKSPDTRSQGSRFIMGDWELGVDSNVDANATYQNATDLSEQDASVPLDVETGLPTLGSSDETAQRIQGETILGEIDTDIPMRRLGPMTGNQTGPA
ncbi:hypothetical protein FRC19_008560 [Serendipita sp. 401]|nr:hypothetical protein FRC19_008560 [Serendipita sp. 401]